MAQFLTNDAVAHALQEQLSELGVHARSFRGDLCDDRVASAMISETVSAFNSLDVVINNLGPFASRDILETTPVDWRSDLDTNLNSAFYTIFHAKEHLIRSKGHVINFAFAGVEHLRSREKCGGYCVAKTGLAVLTRSLASRLAGQEVRVNAVCPGYIDDGVSEGERERASKMIPAGRLGSVQDLVEVVRWLLEESPSYLTGALIPVAGAWSY